MQTDLEHLINEVRANEITMPKWRNDFTSDEYLKAEALNKIIGGSPFSKQKQCVCVPNFYQLLRYKYPLNSEIMSKSEQKFLLKKDKVIITLSGTFTSESNDLELIKLLKINKSFSKHFEKLPENWETIVDGKQERRTPKKVKAKEVTEVVEVVETETETETEND